MTKKLSEAQQVFLRTLAAGRYPAPRYNRTGWLLVERGLVERELNLGHLNWALTPAGRAALEKGGQS